MEVDASGLAGRVEAELRRTLPKGAPFAVAYSGGGDSTALLHILRDRAPLAVIVEHNLSEGTEKRTRLAVERARAMGVEVVVKTWRHDFARANQAKARSARYGLIAEALSDRRIRHLVVAHTLDDAAETFAMSGGSAVMMPVASAPVWPALRGVWLHRPALGERRDALRSYLRAHGVPWLEDPANADTAYTRVRVRRALGGSVPPDVQAALRRHRQLAADDARRLQRELASVSFHPGWAHLDANPSPALLALVAGAVGGQPTYPSPDRVRRLHGGTIGGANIESVKGGMRVTRDPGAVLGRSGVAPLQPLRVEAGREALWDGRVLVRAGRDGAVVGVRGRDGWRAALPTLVEGDATLADVAGPRIHSHLQVQALAIPPQ